MAIFNTPLGMNVKDNPLIVSPFVAGNQLGDGTSPAVTKELITEDGKFILTEDGDFITTE